MAQPERIVFHVDMDAFYATVETRDRPELRDRPVVIGADPQGGRGRGVVSTANYAARRFGIHSAMPISQAWRLCPNAVFMPPDFERYREASHDVMEVFARYADILEVVGMDEAYLDVTQRCGGDWNQAASLARSLQAAVRRDTGLSCSVGIAPNKSVAKIASDRRKPHGVTTVTPAELADFLEPLPTRLVNGCGPKTQAALADVGIETVGELAAADPNTLEARFGSHGRWLWNVARGDDPRAVIADRGPAKSRGNERTFSQDQRDPATVQKIASRLLHGLLQRQDEDRERAFSTVTVKIRYSDFSTLTRSHTLSIPLDPENSETGNLARATVSSLLAPLLDGRSVRLIGVRLSGFCRSTGQRSLASYGAVMAPRPVAA